MNWIELHTDTRYSAVLSFFGAEDIVSTCAQNGCKAVAITDRNTVEGYLIAEREAARKGVSLIYGVTLDCLDCDDRYAITLLAKNQTGRENIFSLLRLMDDMEGSLGRYVTRQQVEAHRDGVLLGAGARDGQLVRAIRLCRSDAVLKKLALTYDYMELPSEPYDVSARLCRISRATGVPACAVQNATVSGDESAWYHAHCAITRYWGKSDEAMLYQSPEELAEDFRELYILPEERDIIEKALRDNQQWIFNQIEPMPTMGELMQRKQDEFHQKMMAKLRQEAQAALAKKYGADIAPGIRERLAQELDDIDNAGAAAIIHILQEVRSALPKERHSLILSSFWNSFFLLYLLDITDADPLTTALSRNGHDMLYIPGFYGKELCSIDVRLSDSALSLVLERLGQTCGSFSAIHSKTTRDSAEPKTAKEIARSYLADCPADLREELEKKFSFYAKVLQYGSECLSLIEWKKVHLLPSMDGLPVNTQSSLPELELDSFLSDWPYLNLYTSSLAAALDACAEQTGILRKDIPLDDPLVFQALRSPRTGEEVTAIGAALKISGFNSTECFIERAKLLNVCDLRGLLRMFGIIHGTDVCKDNQELLLRDGIISPEQVITCREDVCRYLIRRGASQKEAAQFMTYVRKGYAARKGFSDEQLEMLRRCGAEEWFVSACRKIVYLFPEGHSVPFAVGCVQLVWYALNYPDAVEPVLPGIAEESIQQEKALIDYYERKTITAET